MRKTDATAFEQFAAFDQAGDAATALRPVPGIADEGAAVEFGQFVDDTVLQSRKIGFDCCSVHGR